MTSHFLKCLKTYRFKVLETDYSFSLTLRNSKTEHNAQLTFSVMRVMVRKGTVCCIPTDEEHPVASRGRAQTSSL